MESEQNAALCAPFRYSSPVLMLSPLSRRGAKKDARNDSQVTPTLTAVFFGHVPVVEVLLRWCVASAIRYNLKRQSPSRHLPCVA